MSPKEQILARCKQVVETARIKFGMDLSQVRISFDLRGRAAGRATGKRYRAPGSEYLVKFNADMLTREAFGHVHDATVPHEYAHIICFMNPELGKNHNSGWERVCLALGGDGATRHQEDVVYGKGTTYEYTTDRGHKVRMGDRHHASVQRGGTLRYRRGMGNVTMACAYSIIGVRGRTLAAPVVRQAVNHPAVIEAATRAVTKEVPVQQLIPVTPVAPRVTTPAPGESKAAISRRIMLTGFQAGLNYEAIISAMMIANGYSRQLARGTFKANAARVGIPNNFYA